MDTKLADAPQVKSANMLRQVKGPRVILVGNMLDLQRDRLEFSMGMALQYGDVSVFRMGPLPIYMVFHPDGVRRVLMENNHNYSKDSPIFAMMKGVLGNGLLLSEGEFWLKQRRLMQPMFHRQRIAGFGPTMTSATEKALESWQSAATDGSVLDISREMMRLTLDIACRSLFSLDIMGEAGPIEKSINVVQEDFTFRFDHPFYPPASVPTLRNRRYLGAVKALDQIVYGMIAERRAQMERPNYLLSLLLETRDEESGEGMTDKQMRDELVTLLIAGHETTAQTLTWALYLLSKYPEAESRIHAEVELVTGGRKPEVSDLPELDYTRRVIDETMRLYPPAWVTNRKAIAEDEVCGYHIPAGATIGVSPYVTHRLPEFWENPEGFDPDRFTPEQVKERPSFAYFPFGGGPRMCIGKGFALTEAPLVLATIVQRCKLALLPGHDVRKGPLVTLRPAGGLPMMVAYRD